MFKSNTAEFLRQVDRALNDSANTIGNTIVVNVKEESPVRTGFLRGEVNYQIFDGEPKELIIYDTAEYAPYVELGTYKMAPNPFMRRGIEKSKQDIIDTLLKELKV